MEHVTKSMSSRPIRMLFPRSPPNVVAVKFLLQSAREKFHRQMRRRIPPNAVKLDRFDLSFPTCHSVPTPETLFFSSHVGCLGLCSQTHCSRTSSTSST